MKKLDHIETSHRESMYIRSRIKNLLIQMANLSDNLSMYLKGKLIMMNNNTEMFLDTESTVKTLDKEYKFFSNNEHLKPIKEELNVIFTEIKDRINDLNTLRKDLLAKIEKEEELNKSKSKDDDNRKLIKKSKESIYGTKRVSKDIANGIFNNDNTNLDDINWLFWSSKQNELRRYQKEFEDKIVGDSFSRQDDLDKLMRISVRTKEVKDKIADKEKKLSRELNLTEKHLIRDDIRQSKLFKFALENDNTIELDDVKVYLENKETLQTLGNEVMVVLKPYDKDSKKHYSTNKDRIEVKVNDKLNNPNVSYGFFHEFKEDKDGNVLLVIRDKQRELIGETADASVTKYAWSQFPSNRIKRFFIKARDVWHEYDKEGNLYEIKDIWKEVDVNNPRNQD